jgi:uncharacterized membrane protein
MNKTITTTTTKGLLIGLVLVVISIATYLSGIDVNSPVKYLSFIIFIAGILWSISNYGKQIDYNSTFGNYFSHGFKISALVTLIMIAFIVLLFFIFPEQKEKALEESKKAMQAQKNLTDEQINTYLQTVSKFYNVIAIGFTLFSYLFIGAIASLIGAAITKKQPNQFVEDVNPTKQ